MNEQCSSVGLVAYVLVLLGALNWGLVGAFDWNLVTTILGDGTTATQVVYIVIGLAALYKLVLWGRCAK